MESHESAIHGDGHVDGRGAKGRPVTCAFPSMPPEISHLIYELFGILHQLLTEAQLTYWLDGGSALGCERHGGLIPWDDDGDIEMFECDQLRLEKEVIEKVHQHQLNQNSTSPDALSTDSIAPVSDSAACSLSCYEFIRTYFGWKFCSRSSPLVKGHPWRYPSIDIFFVQLPPPTRVQLSPPTTAEMINSGSIYSPSVAAESRSSPHFTPVRLPFSSSVAQKCWGRMNWYAHEILAPPQHHESTTGDGIHSNSDASDDSANEIESDSESTSTSEKRPRPPRFCYSSSRTSLHLRPFGPLQLYAPSSQHLRSYLTRSYGADWNECAYRTFDHEREKKLQGHLQTIKVQLQPEDRLPAAASLTWMERIGVTSLPRIPELSHPSTTPSADREQPPLDHFGFLTAPAATFISAASTSLAGKLYRDALHTIFQFLSFQEFIPACRVNHSWLTAGQTMRTRKDRLDYKGPIERLVTSPLRVHVHHLVLSVMFDDNSLLLLRDGMSHLDRLDLTVIVKRSIALKSSAIPLDCFVLPSRLRELNLTFQPAKIGTDATKTKPALPSGLPDSQLTLRPATSSAMLLNVTNKNLGVYFPHCIQQIATCSTRLETLYLSFGSMGGIMACPESLRLLTTLTDITLSGRLNIDQQIDLIKSLPRVRRWIYIGRLKSESIIRLTDNSGGTGLLLPHLEQLSYLTDVDELMAKQLARLIRLTHLDLRRMALEDPRTFLTSFPHLVKLELSAQFEVNLDHLSEALSDCRSLTHLVLNHHLLKSHHLTQFLPHLPLVHLALDRCVNVTSLEFLTHAVSQTNGGHQHGLMNLRSFSIHGSFQIPVTEYHHLHSIAPSLEYLTIDELLRYTPTDVHQHLTPSTRPMSEWPKLPGTSVPFRREEWPLLKNFTLTLESSLLSRQDPPRRLVEED